MKDTIDNALKVRFDFVFIAMILIIRIYNSSGKIESEEYVAQYIVNQCCNIARNKQYLWYNIFVLICSATPASWFGLEKEG